MEESTRPYAFGPFRLNPHTLELHRGEEPVPLEPLPARILVRLVDEAGEMVTRRELRELGWPRLPDAAEQSLNTCIRQIRDALGDEASAPEYVQTLRGRGYRFIARVERPEARARPARVGGPRWTSFSALGYPWAPAAMAVALLLLITGVWLADPVTRMRDGTRTRLPGVSDTTASATARALGLSPDAEHRLLKARFLYDDQGDFSLALALVDSVIAEEPELAEAHGLRAELLLFLGRAEAAGVAASRAIALDPRQPDGQRATAGLLMLRGDWEEAESVLHGVLERVPEHVPTLIALAYLLTVRGRFDEAARTIEQSRRVDPLTPVLAGDAGLMHYWAGRYEAAADACQETLQLRPDATWAMACVFDALLLELSSEVVDRTGLKG